MQAGDFNEQIKALELVKTDSIFSWSEKRSTWAKAEPQKQKNLFSDVGIGVKSVKFTIRKQEISLHNAICWQGKHCFLTDITEIDHMYYEVTAALIEPKSCILKRVDTTKDALKDALNRPKASDPQIIATFPGCMVEKYMGFTRLNPQNQIDAQFVLVTPKEITAKTGDLAVINDITYNVRITHELDEFKNEYEIAVKKEP